MEDRTYQKVVAIIAVAAIFVVAFYGSYAPMRKAQMFISTLQSLQTSPATSLQDLETRISAPINYYAPIGQEELVRNMANSVLSFIQQGGDASSTAALIQFLQTYYDPIIARGKGMSFGQDLYLEGAINEIAFAQTGDPTYLEAAQRYYAEGNQLAPNRPQPLYGLFDVYRAGGDIKDALIVGTTILNNWNDQRIQQSLMQLVKTPTSTPATSSKK
jgi:hypothetical protein